MPQQHTIITYSFDELSPEAQQKAIDDNRFAFVDDDWWSDCTLVEWKETLNEKGFEGSTIYFDLFGKGGGACFDVERLDLIKLLSALEGLVSNDVYKKMKRFIPKLVDAGVIHASIERNQSHYVHKHSRKVVIEMDFYLTKKNLSALLSQFESAVQGLRLVLCNEIYENLMADYEFQTSDECIKDLMAGNDFQFLSNGKLYSR